MYWVRLTPQTFDDRYSAPTSACVSSTRTHSTNEMSDSRLRSFGTRNSSPDQGGSVGCRWVGTRSIPRSRGCCRSEVIRYLEAVRPPRTLSRDEKILRWDRLRMRSSVEIQFFIHL